MTAKLMHHQSYSWTPGARQHSTGPHKEGRKPIRRLLSAELLVCLAALQLPWLAEVTFNSMNE